MQQQGMKAITLPVNPSVIMQHPKQLLGFAGDMQSIFRGPDLKGVQVKITSGPLKVETVSLLTLIEVIVRGVGELTIWISEGFADHISHQLHTLFRIPHPKDS